jgi:hypothetical protein
MAVATLVDRDIKDGRSLIQQSDKDKFPATSAFRFYRSESESWHLLIASPVVDRGGKLETSGSTARHP